MVEFRIPPEIAGNDDGLTIDVVALGWWAGVWLVSGVFVAAFVLAGGPA